MSAGATSRRATPVGRRLLAAGTTVVVALLGVPGSTPAGLTPDVGRFGPLWVSGYGGGAVDYAPDGTRVAVAGAGVVFILNGESYAIERQLFADHVGWAVRWSPDGQYVAAGSESGRVTVWEVDTGAVMATLQGSRTRRIRAVSWSPDSRQLASAGYDAVIDLWDIPTGELVRTIPVGFQLHAVSWSQDGELLASGSVDGVVRIWDASTGTLIREFPRSQWALMSVAWHPESQWLASGGVDGTVRIWDVGTGTLVQVLPNLVDVESLAWSRDGKYLGCGRGVTGLIWEVDTWRLLRTLEEVTGGVRHVAWRPDGEVLVSTGSGTVTAWDVGTGKRRASLRGNGSIEAISWSPAGEAIAAAGGDYPRGDAELIIWDVATGSAVRTIRDGCLGRVFAVAWSPDGRSLAADGGCGAVRLWDMQTGEELWRAVRAVAGNAVAWRPDSRYLAARDDDRAREFTTGLRDAATGTLLRVLEGAGIGVTWSPDGRHVAALGGNLTGHESRTLVWEAATGDLVHQFDEPGFVQLWALAWSPDSRYLATGGSGVTPLLRLWDVTTGELVDSIPSGRLRSLAWHPAGRYLAAGTEAGGPLVGEIRIWDLETGALVTTLRGHSGTVSGLQWSPDGRVLASGGDATVRLWGEPAAERE